MQRSLRIRVFSQSSRGRIGRAPSRTWNPKRVSSSLPITLTPTILSTFPPSFLLPDPSSSSVSPSLPLSVLSSCVLVGSELVEESPSDNQAGTGASLAEVETTLAEDTQTGKSGVMLSVETVGPTGSEIGKEQSGAVVAGLVVSGTPEKSSDLSEVAHEVHLQLSAQLSWILPLKHDNTSLRSTRPVTITCRTLHLRASKGSRHASTRCAVRSILNIHIATWCAVVGEETRRKYKKSQAVDTEVMEVGVVPDVVMDSQQRKGEAESTESQVERAEAATQSEDGEPPEDVVILAYTLLRERNRTGWCYTEVWLHEREKMKHEEGQHSSSNKRLHSQWAASERPRKFRTRLERSLYDGPTARRDAEEAERQRWLHILADLVRHSPTPMEQLLAAQPGNVEVLGAGKRASTLRSRVSLLHVTHTQSVDHYTEYLRVRLSEPCNREALKTAHHAPRLSERADGYSGPGPFRLRQSSIL